MSTDTAPVNVTQNVDTDALQGVADQLPMLIEETKKGYKTTEFWLTVLGLVVVNVNGLVMSLPDKWQAIASAILAGLYALSRGQAKKGIPSVTVAPAVTVESPDAPTT